MRAEHSDSTPGVGVQQTLCDSECLLSPAFQALKPERESKSFHDFYGELVRDSYSEQWWEGATGSGAGGGRTWGLRVLSAGHSLELSPRPMLLPLPFSSQVPAVRWACFPMALPFSSEPH